MPSEIEVTAGLIIKSGEQILIAQRSASDNHPHLWEFPGGKREASETLEECLRRELKEELDLTVGTVTYFREVSHALEDRKLKIHAFLCPVGEVWPKAIVHAIVKWESRQNLHLYKWLPSDMHLVADLQKKWPL